MQLHRAMVRPGGQVTHEVPRHDLTAPEIILLRQIHGDDAVTHISRTKADHSKRKPAERDRLVSIYGEKAVAAAFGNSYGADLPDEVPKAWLNNAPSPFDAQEEETADTAEENPLQ